MPSNRINSVEDIQCGFVCKVPLIDEIEYFEKILIPMIEEYGEDVIKVSLAEAKKELIKMKEEIKND